MRPCIQSDETLRSHLRARLAQLEEMIAPAISKDLDASDHDLRPQLVAASLTAAFNVLTERGEGPKGKPKSADDRAALIDPVITFLRGGLDALNGASHVTPGLRQTRDDVRTGSVLAGGS
jgi:hypothetical protein